MAVMMLYRSTVGKKVLMAATGFIWVGYVIVHMLGNLKIFEGPATLNAYAVFLREVGGPLLTHESVLWFARLVLVAALVVHIVMAYQLSRLDLASRPVHYDVKRSVQQSYASRTMRWGGVIIGLFILYHVLHLTTGTLHQDFQEGDVYRNVVIGFTSPIVSLVYIVAMVALGLHLYHGVWSMFQTLGVVNVRNTRAIGALAAVIAVGVAVGNISIPLAVLLGVVGR